MLTNSSRAIGKFPLVAEERAPCLSVHVPGAHEHPEMSQHTEYSSGHHVGETELGKKLLTD